MIRSKLTGRRPQPLLPADDQSRKKGLANPEHILPDYDSEVGYEIAGFVWFQGWNDMVDSGTYPDRGKVGVGYPKYSEWMADLIRDVRKDLAAPKCRSLSVYWVSAVRSAKTTVRDTK